MIRPVISYEVRENPEYKLEDLLRESTKIVGALQDQQIQSSMQQFAGIIKALESKGGIDNPEIARVIKQMRAQGIEASLENINAIGNGMRYSSLEDNVKGFLFSHDDEFKALDADTGIDLLVNYARISYNLFVAHKATVLDPGMPFSDKTLPKRAEKVMRLLPLSYDGKDVFEMVHRYLRVLEKTMLVGPTYDALRERLLDENNLDMTQKYLSDDDWFLAIMNPVGRDAMAASSFINQESEDKKVDGDTAVLTSAIHSYSYFGQELDLLKERAVDMAREGMANIENPEDAVILELGPGHEKLSEYILGVRANGVNVSKVYLVDSNQKVLDENKEELLKKFPDISIVDVRSSFEKMSTNPDFQKYLDEKTNNKHVTFFGTTCCNMYPEPLLKLLKSTKAQTYVIGVYPINSEEDVYEILYSYLGKDMAKQALKGVNLLIGDVSDEQLEKSLRYVPQMITENWMNGFIRQWPPLKYEEGHFADNFDREEVGDLFEKVRVIRAGFIVEEQITTGLGRVYNPGDRANGFFSIKYTPEQFKEIMKIGGLDLASEHRNKDVRIYVANPKNN